MSIGLTDESISCPLRACPFCGHEEAQAIMQLDAVNVYWLVECPNCGAKGPPATEKQQAKIEWTYRAHDDVTIGVDKSE